jgi:hypothetical protein
MRLPNADRATVSREKVVDYLLNPSHPDGASKAAFFLAMGFQPEKWQVLATAFQRLAQREEAICVDSPHGSKYIVKGEIDTPSGLKVTIRTVWIVDNDSEIPRLVTAFPDFRRV